MTGVVPGSILRPMTRLALFCDGTWNTAEAKQPTNVWLLAAALAARGADGVPQKAFYVAGVGTGRGLSDAPSRWVDRWAGGALGWGLDDNVLDAYRALVRAWVPGDEVFVFGFSRGAYTARSLGGLLRRAGILKASEVARVPEAMELYRRRGDPRTGRDAPEMMAWRARHAPDTPTSAAEVAWRKAKGLPAPPPLRLAYMGVWDTVGALGVPGHLTAAPLFNGTHQFHDTDLSSMVRRARHAVAIDERRRAYEPTLWTNLPERNREEMGLSPGADPLTAGLDPPYRQEWFPGDHGAVGGGSRHLGLSSLACDWVAEGARDAGLAFQPDPLAAIRAAQDPTGTLETLDRSWLAALFARADRDGPDDPRSVSQAARRRLAALPGYAPRTLGKVMRWLRA